jgi:hypothetical protein
MFEFKNFPKNTQTIIDDRSRGKSSLSKEYDSDIIIYFVNSSPYIPPFKIINIHAYMAAVKKRRVSLIGEDDVMGYEKAGVATYYPAYYQQTINL